jgi:hypothetical protein
MDLRKNLKAAGSPRAQDNPGARMKSPYYFPQDREGDRDPSPSVRQGAAGIIFS